MEINSFEEFLKYAKESKEIYKGFSCSFFKMNLMVEHRKYWKKVIYGIPCKPYQEYKKDIIWEWLNDDISYKEMKDILERRQ